MLGLSVGGMTPRASDGTVATVQDLRSRSDAPGTVVVVEGYHEPGDGGGGLFVRASSSRASKVTSTDRAKGALWTPAPGDGGPWVRVAAFNGPLNVKWFGARGDGSADASGPINKAIWTAGFLGVDHTYIPQGTYRLDAPIVFTWISGQSLTGDGAIETVLKKEQEGTAETDLTEGPIDAVIIVPAGQSTGTGGEEPQVIDTHSVTIKNLQVRGKPAPKDASFERTYGIYVERLNQSSLENIDFRFFDRAFYAGKCWMSRLVGLRAKHVNTFIDLSATPGGDGVAGASTSLSIQNCYCRNDVRGDAFVLSHVYYSTLQNCGADEVDGWPYVIDECRAVNLISCGFEQSKNAKGILFRASVATAVGCKAIQPHHYNRSEETASVLKIIGNEQGRSSAVTVIACHFANYGSPRQPSSPPDAMKEMIESRIIDSQSRATIIDTRFPSNASPDETNSMPEGRVLELAPGKKRGTQPQGGANTAALQLSDISGTNADRELNENFSAIEAKLQEVLDQMEAK